MERNTIQRDIVLAEMKTIKNHATADEIFERVRKDHPSISRSTVYRNLQKLSEKGLIKKREIPGQADVFDPIITKHYHIKCCKCSKIFDVDMDYIEDLEKLIKDRHGFTFSNHDILFTGICPDCQKKSE